MDQISIQIQQLRGEYDFILSRYDHGAIPPGIAKVLKDIEAKIAFLVGQTCGK